MYPIYNHAVTVYRSTVLSPYILTPPHMNNHHNHLWFSCMVFPIEEGFIQTARQTVVVVFWEKWPPTVSIKIVYCIVDELIKAGRGPEQ